jgi:hypothetical protein
VYIESGILTVRLFKDANGYYSIFKGLDANDNYDSTKFDLIKGIDTIKLGDGDDSLAFDTTIDFTLDPMTIDMGGGINSIGISKAGIINTIDLLVVANGLTIIGVSSYLFGSSTNETYNADFDNKVTVSTPGGNVVQDVNVNINGGSKKRW